MKLLLTTALIFIATSLSSISDVAAQELVRVRLKSQQDEIFISGYGLRIQGAENKFQQVAIARSENIRIRRFSKDGASFWLVTRSQSSRSQIISDPLLAIDGQDLKAQAQNLPKQILLSPSGKVKMDLVGVLPINEYLTGVIASEMPLSWPMETLKAQAIAARSYTLAVMKERRNKAYHLESSVMDQVFKHVVLNDGDQLIRKASQAVNETKNMQIMGDKGNVLKAFYHSDCGGKTASAKNVWNMSASGGEAVDESCPTNPKAHWHINVSKENIFAKIKKFLALDKSDKEQDQIKELKFNSIPSEERLKDVTVILNSGRQLKLNGNDFRGLIGFQDLKSNLFKVQVSEKEFAFVGRGFGHGVGLCQWGSRMLGLQGKKFPEILKHYYPQARLITRN